jgi:pimeloyl-ACP methyl ester carboxylesterase
VLVAGVIAAAGEYEHRTVAWTLLGTPRRGHAVIAKLLAVGPTTVLGHGALANTASWSGMITDLEAQGYTVHAPANPMRSLHGVATIIADFLSA